MGRTAVFLVNRSPHEAATVTLDVAALDGVAVLEALTLTSDDAYAANTLTDPVRVGLVPNETVVAGKDTATVTLPPVSWTVVVFGRDQDALLP